MRYNLLIVLATLTLLLVATGCTTIDPQNMLKTNSQVQSFMDLYPNSNIQIVTIVAANVDSVSQDFVKECSVQPEKIDYYRATLSNSDVVLHVWINKKTQEFVCIFRESKNDASNQPETNISRQAVQDTINNNSVSANIPLPTTTTSLPVSDAGLTNATPISSATNISVSQPSLPSSYCNSDVTQILLSSNQPITMCINHEEHKFTVNQGTSSTSAQIKVDDTSFKTVPLLTTTTSNGVTFYINKVLNTNIPNIQTTVALYLGEVSTCSPDTESVLVSTTEQKTVCINSIPRKISLETDSLDSNGKPVVSVNIDSTAVPVNVNTTVHIDGITYYVGEVITSNIPTPQTAVTIYFKEAPAIILSPVKVTMETPTIVTVNSQSRSLTTKWFSLNAGIVCVDGICKKISATGKYDFNGVTLDISSLIISNIPQNDVTIVATPSQNSVSDVLSSAGRVIIDTITYPSVTGMNFPVTGVTVSLTLSHATRFDANNNTIYDILVNGQNAIKDSSFVIDGITFNVNDAYHGDVPHAGDFVDLSYAKN